MQSRNLWVSLHFGLSLTSKCRRPHLLWISGHPPKPDLGDTLSKKKNPKPQPTDIERISAFVRRLRRIEAHPLVAVDKGKSIYHWYTTPFRMNVLLRRSDGEPIGTQVIYELPDEVQFESLAARLRPMTLATDVLGHKSVMDSLDALTAHLDNDLVREANADVRAKWEKATARDRENRGALSRAYKVVIHTADGDVIEELTDVDLAYGWLYEDSMHGDLPSMDQVSARDRYFAAVTVFCHVALAALHTLNYIRELVANGLLVLPDEAMDAPVVSESSWTENVAAVMTDLDVDLEDFSNAGTVPEGAFSLEDMVREHYLATRATDDTAEADNAVDAEFEATVHIGEEIHAVSEAEGIPAEAEARMNALNDKLTGGDRCRLT